MRKVDFEICLELPRIKRFANALFDGVPVRKKDRLGSEMPLLRWLRECRLPVSLNRGGPYSNEKGGLNFAKLTD